MIHLPNSFTEPEETACGLVFGPVVVLANRVIESRDEWWSVDCARCLNSPRGLALLRLAESTEDTAERDALTAARSGTRLSLDQFNSYHLHTGGWQDHINAVPV